MELILETGNVVCSWYLLSYFVMAVLGSFWPEVTLGPLILIQLSLFSITTSWTLAYFWLLWLKMGMLWMWNMRERKKIFFSLYFYRSWDLIENDSLFLTYILHFLYNLCFLHDTFFPDLFLIFQILDHAFLHSLSIYYLPHNLFSSTFTLFCLQVFKLIIWCFILYTVE